MRHIDRFARTLAFLLLFLAWTNGGAAEFAAPTGDGWHVWQVRSSLSDREFDDIYVQMKAGKVTDIEIQTSNCYQRNRSPLNELGIVPNSASVAWLKNLLDSNTRVSEGAIAAISVHAGDKAFTILTDLLEDRSRGKKTREQALFWLAHSDSDQAFEYLDRLLSSN